MHYLVKGFDANGHMISSLPIFAASVTAEAMQPAALLMLSDAGHPDCAKATVEAACPKCKGVPEDSTIDGCEGCMACDFHGTREGYEAMQVLEKLGRETLTAPVLRYTEADSERANKEWKATCGPHSIAASLGKALDQVRPALTNYKGWMSPTQVTQALLALGVPHNLKSRLKTMALCNGLNRVQWEGKWLNPGVPARVAYFHTHWVAAFDGWVLCTACVNAKWITEASWRRFHIEDEPRSPFHITHHYELPRPA